MLYAYTGRDSCGFSVSGTREASSVAALVSQLKRDRVSLILTIDEASCCSYCGKSLTERSWFNPFSGTSQCHRLWCRIKTGHWLRRKYKRAVCWKTVIIKIPVGLMKTEN